MTDQKKKELFPYFAYVYSIMKDPDKYGKSKFEDWYNQVSSNKPLLGEISQVAADSSGKYDKIWAKAEEVYNTKGAGNQSGGGDDYSEATSGLADSSQYAKKGSKLDTLKKLQSTKASPKKCKCGCEMISVKEEGGKMTSKCACNCGGSKIKMKSKGGILYKDDIESLNTWGVIDSSISNKWERKLNSHKLGKFKK